MAKTHPITQFSLTEASKSHLLSLLPRFIGQRVLIVGDVGLDEYILGEVRRISPEAPVPVLDVESEDMRLGLAANVAQNVRSLGGEPILISVVGKDLGAEKLQTLCEQAQVSTQHFIVDPKRPTTRKARIIAKQHHLVRVDYETRQFLSADIEDLVFKKAESLISKVDVVILEDYAKGVVTQTLVQKMVELCRKNSKKLLVDPHRNNVGEFYQGVDLIKPNFEEAVALSGMKYDELRDHPDRVLEVGQALIKKTSAKTVVLTQGKEGMSLFSDQKITKVPTFARQVFDVTGAGDTVIASLALGTAAGLSLVDTCSLANFAAGVVVGHVGCVPCSQEELREYISNTQAN